MLTATMFEQVLHSVVPKGVCAQWQRMFYYNIHQWGNLLCFACLYDSLNDPATKFVLGHLSNGVWTLSHQFFKEKASGSGCLGTDALLQNKICMRALHCLQHMPLKLCGNLVNGPNAGDRLAVERSS